MSSRKDVLLPYQLFTDRTMQTDLTSSVVTIQYLDNVAIQMGWTGNATGTFSVEGSLNYNARSPSSAIWTALSFSTTPSASGSSDDILLDLNQLSFPFIRSLYTSTFLSGAITTVADVAGSLAGKYCLVNAITPNKFAFWFKVSGSGTAPVVAGYTSVEVDISTGATATAVATALAAVMALQAGLERVDDSTNHVYFNIVSTGGTVGAGDSGFTITNTDTTGILNQFISAKMV